MQPKNKVSVEQMNETIAKFDGWVSNCYSNLPNKMHRIENGQEIGGDRGVRFVRMENGSVVFEVESGNYHFRSPM